MWPGGIHDYIGGEPCTANPSAEKDADLADKVLNKLRYYLSQAVTEP
jgi:hypothetical protein